MYLATVDPHVAYNPPERFLKSYWPKPYRGPVKPPQTSEQLYAIKIGKLKLNDEDKRYLEALYDAEVTQNDAAFLQMVGDLKQMGLYDKTAIVVVSDHGDEFFDHGSVGHGHSLYQELVDVPLLVRWPPLFPEAKVVSDCVEVEDLFATLLDLAGLDGVREVQGESLAPLAADDGPRMDRPAASFHDGALRSLRIGRWKLLTWSGARMALYDLDADRHEKKDIAADHPIALRYARDAFALLHAYEGEWKKSLWGVVTDLRPAFADEIGM
jgi:arylsulfatase A-like enzyme